MQDPSFAASLVPIRIEDEMKNSYLDYSMSVIIGRALPDVRDGLKPVHRRILYAMDQEGLQANKKYSKCAGVVGEVLKKYHPHGDSAVYDALVRMAQPWNLRYLLVDGQGNFGSVDGDPAAAYRYTECKMTKLAEELLTDIGKETVSFSPNFDGTTLEPDVLPARFPNLLVNGADGIAVGMATKIPPHNLNETITACIAVIDNPAITVDELIEIVPGPDFPTAGTIYGRKGVREAYETGRGKIVLRGRADFEETKDGRRAIVIDEIPYQVNKARLIEHIAELHKEKKLEGISALRDESSREGMRIVIELKRDAVGEIVLNNLYKHTALQTTFGVIMLAIVNQQPRVLTLKDMLQLYIAHRRDVILRRTRFELAEARARAHILEGFERALDMLDALIAAIRASATPAEAKERLLNDPFLFSAAQADAILEMRLQRLTGMERQKILDELAQLRQRIGELEAILGSDILLMGVVKTELIEVRDQFSDARRTRIVDARGEISLHDLIAEEDQIVTVSHRGYIKRCSPSEWRMQKRGGVGKQGMSTRDEDFVTSFFVANTHSLLLVFTHTGTVFPLAVFDVPEAGRGAKGRPIVNLVPIGEGERIASVVSTKELDADKGELVFVTRRGFVKRIEVAAFKNARAGGLIGTAVRDDDELVMVIRVDDAAGDLMLLTKNGKCIRFPLRTCPRKKGRNTYGVGGIKVIGDDAVVDAVIVPGLADVPPEVLEVAEDEAAEDDAPEVDEPDDEEEDDEDDDADAPAEPEAADHRSLLTVTSLGFGKRVDFDKYRLQKRYGKGILSLKVDAASTGVVVGAISVLPDDELMLTTDSGRVIRIRAGDVRLVKGRSSKGVRLMRLEDDERIVDLVRLDEAVEPEVAETPADESPPEADSSGGETT